MSIATLKDELLRELTAAALARSGAPAAEPEVRIHAIRVLHRVGRPLIVEHLSAGSDIWIGPPLRPRNWPSGAPPYAISGRYTVVVKADGAVVDDDVRIGLVYLRAAAQYGAADAPPDRPRPMPTINFLVPFLEAVLGGHVRDA